MKAQERHHLKSNEFAERAAWVADQVTTNRSRILGIAGAVIAIAAIVGGYFYFQSRAKDNAAAMLGAALAIQQSPVTAAAVPGVTPPAGTYTSAAARGEAALAAFQKVAAAYTSGDTGAAARYFIGTTYLELGKGADADKAFTEAAAMGSGTLYGDMAQLGRGQALAAQAKWEDAVKTLTDLSAKRDTAVPVDGILMELARVCRKAGKLQEARAAFKRVADEFPQSNYAGEARQQLSTMG